MPKDEKYEIEKKPSTTPQPEGGGLFDINPAVRRESQNLLADIGDAAGWGALLGGTALLFTPAAPAGATAAVTGLGALGAGAYLGEGLIDMRAGDYSKGAQKVALAAVDAMTPSARQGQAVSQAAKKARRGVLVKTGVVYPLVESAENTIEGAVREMHKADIPPAVESMPTANKK